MLVHAPRGRDAGVVLGVLHGVGGGCFTCATLSDVAAELVAGAGTAVVTEESLAAAGLDRITAWLRAQASWSDFPVIVLVAGFAGTRLPAAAARLASLGNVVLLERPINAETLASATESALRTRRRQYAARDQLTALARSEEQLRLALEAGRLGSWECNLQAQQLAASATCRAHFGFGPHEPFTTRHLIDAMHPDDRDAQVKALRLAAVRRSSLDMEYRTVWPDGGVHWVYIRGKVADPVRSADRSHDRMVGVTIDVTERKAAQLELRVLNERLEGRIAERTEALQWANEQLLAEIAERERAEAALVQMQKMEAVGQLTGGIAHDFNNLLTAILGNLELIGRRTTDERIARTAGYARDAVGRATKLTGQLLAFSRTPQLDLRPVAVDTLVAGMQNLLGSSVGHTIEIRTDLHAGSATAVADANQLELAVLNLIINARDAMHGSGVLTIATRLDRADGGDLPSGRYVVLSVADTGAGIAADVLPKVFDPFFTTKAVGKGTGLGLSQVYGIARQSGGIARAHNGPAGGAIVEIWLPAAAGSKEPPTPGRPDSQPSASPYGHGERVLVIDDDPDVRRYLVECVESLNYVVTQAEHGLAGLARLDEDAPDLMIVDFAMPGVNGAEVAVKAKQRRAGLPVILVTGYAEAGAVDRLRGTDMVLRKPFALDELAVAIRRSLKG